MTATSSRILDGIDLIDGDVYVQGPPHDQWRRLRRDAPQLTDGHNPTIMSADVNGRHVWRLRADGFEDIAAARAFCIGIRTANADCWVVPAYAIR